MKFALSVAVLGMLAAPVFAESHGGGDAVAGEKVFKKCQACHNVVDPDGAVLAGRKGKKSGPNLYQVIGRTAGAFDGYSGFSSSLVEAGEAGLVWDEATLAAFIQDPKAYLKEYLEDPKARSKMSLRLKGADKAADVAAFLASLAPAE